MKLNRETIGKTYDIGCYIAKIDRLYLPTHLRKIPARFPALHIYIYIYSHVLTLNVLLYDDRRKITCTLNTSNPYPNLYLT